MTRASHPQRRSSTRRRFGDPSLGVDPSRRRFLAATIVIAQTAACGASGRVARIDGSGLAPPTRAPSRYFPRERGSIPESEFHGDATWYGGRFHGRTTANGERFDVHLMTAAHRELPFNTIVRVIREDDRRSVVVRINDRGPGSQHRVIDLSWAAAHEIGMVEEGHTVVRLEILEWGDGAVYE